MRRGTPSAILFGDFLIAIRGPRPQREICEPLSLPPATISMFERGTRSVKMLMVPKLAYALGVSEKDLFELWFLAQGRVTEYQDEHTGEPLEEPRLIYWKYWYNQDMFLHFCERIAEVLDRTTEQEFVLEPDGLPPIRKDKLRSVLTYYIPVREIEEVPPPIIRRRAKTINVIGLEELVKQLTGPERSRVRGYIDEVIGERAFSQEKQGL